MRSAFVVLLLSTALSSGYTPAPTQARPRTIAEAEAEGAAHPRSTASSEAGPRTCLVVTPDRIVFPSTTGNPADYHLRFGDFFAGSISFDWGSTYELAKLPLEPLVPTEAGNGLLIRVIRIDPAPTESTTFAELPQPP